MADTTIVLALPTKLADMYYPYLYGEILLKIPGAKWKIGREEQDVVAMQASGKYYAALEKGIAQIVHRWK